MDAPAHRGLSRRRRRHRGSHHALAGSRRRGGRAPHHDPAREGAERGRQRHLPALGVAVRAVQHPRALRRRHRQVLGAPAGAGADRGRRGADRRAPDSRLAVERDRRGLPLHALVGDDAARRAEGPARLGARARVPQGAGCLRRHFLGRRHQAVPDHAGPGAPARLQPHPQAGLRRRRRQQRQRRRLLHPLGPVRADRARHRHDPDHARHREHRGGGAAGNAGARARPRHGGHRPRHPARGARP